MEMYNIGVAFEILEDGKTAPSFLEECFLAILRQ